MYSISLILYGSSLLYGIFFIYELPQNYLQNDPSNNNNNNEVEPIKPHKKPFLKDFFDVKYIKDTFKVVFKNGEYNRKKRVILIMVVMIDLL